MENEVTRYPSPGAKLAEALAKAQGAIEVADKSKENPAFSRGDKKSTYADISDVIEVIKKPASENGLSVMFDYKYDANGPWIKYRLLHSSGEFVESNWLFMFLRDKTAHGFGAAVTYYRRQMLKSIYQIAEEDDDGNEASGKGKPQEPPQKPPTPPQTPQGKAPSKPGAKVSDAQIKRLYAIATNNGWTKQDMHDEIKKRWNYESTHELDKRQYDILVLHVETHRFNKPPTPPETPPADENFDQHPDESYGSVDAATFPDPFDAQPVTLVDQLVKYAGENNFTADDVKAAITEVIGKLKRSSDMTDIEIQSVLRYLRILKNNRK